MPKIAIDTATDVDIFIRKTNLERILYAGAVFILFDIFNISNYIYDKTNAGKGVLASFVLVAAAVFVYITIVRVLINRLTVRPFAARGLYVILDSYVYMHGSGTAVRY